MTHTPDIMEKARELAIKIDEDCCKELSGTDFMAGYSSNITKMTSLIAAALAEARAVPDGYVPNDNGLDQRTAKGKAVAAILPMFLQTQRAQSDNGDGRSTIHECKARQVISEVYDLLMIYCGSRPLQPLPASPNPPIAGGGL